MSVPIAICYQCKNKKKGLFCEAFSMGIPEEILFGKNDHTEPYEGDNGIQFEPIEE